jgi:hypothetical protein
VLEIVLGLVAAVVLLRARKARRKRRTAQVGSPAEQLLTFGASAPATPSFTPASFRRDPVEGVRDRGSF